MKASELDKKFDDNKEDILQHFDTSQVKVLNASAQQVNMEFPLWMIESLDREAKHIGVSRQAIIKIWLADKLKDLNYSSI